MEIVGLLDILLIVVNFNQIPNPYFFKTSFLLNKLRITLDLVEKAELSKNSRKNITGDGKMIVSEFRRPTSLQLIRLASLHYISAFRSKFLANWSLKQVLITQKYIECIDTNDVKLIYLS